MSQVLMKANQLDGCIQLDDCIFGYAAGAQFINDGLVRATVDSLRRSRERGRDIDWKDIMDRYAAWLEYGAYTSHGVAEHVGTTTMRAILRYETGVSADTCGCGGVNDNGSGSLMRILPFCLYAYEKEMTPGNGFSLDDAIALIHRASALTHAHIRAKIACGIYYFAVRRLLDAQDAERTSACSRKECLEEAVNEAFRYYRGHLEDVRELYYYNRLRNLDSLQAIPASEMLDDGYVVNTLTMIVWEILRTAETA